MTLFQMICILCDVILKCMCTNTPYFEISACYNNTSTLNMNKNYPRVVDVVTGSTVHLWCQYCEEKEDYFPKLWFYKPRGYKPLKEISIQTDTNDLTTKLTMTPFHRLNIIKFNDNNSGIYLCKKPEIKPGNIFIYILEGVFYIQVSPKVGSFSQWQEYKRNYLDSINKSFKVSEEEPFKSIRNKFNITIKLITIWDDWSECKEIDHQKGIRKRTGRCRLRPGVVNNTCKNILKKPINIIYNSVNTSCLTDGFDIPCRSLQLNKTVPEISKIIRNIPDFEAEETCHVLKRAVKHKANKDKYRHRTMKQVTENSHVTLLCSEVVPNSDLKWFKNEKLLNSLFRRSKNEEEPHISVDTNNSLHILHISKNQEGNYSCLVNGQKVQEFEVKVVSKSKLLNQEFLRYSIYLGFVLSLTMTCYFAGVCVAWHRRSSFADPLNLIKKGNHDYNSLQCEREKLLK